MEELEKQLKGLAQRQTNDQLLSKLRLKVDIPNEPVEPPPETAPLSAASPPPAPAIPPAAAPRPGEIDPLNRSLGSQLPQRPAEPASNPGPLPPERISPGDDMEKMRQEMERTKRDMKRKNGFGTSPYSVMRTLDPFGPSGVT